MYIKYLDSNSTTCNISGFTIVAEGVLISGANLDPVEGCGFKIYDTKDSEDVVVFDGEKYIHIYDSSDTYIIYADGSTVYYDFLVLDDNDRVISITMRKNLNTIKNGWLYKSGVTRADAEFEFTYLDATYGLPIYKVSGGTLMRLSDEEFNATKAEFLSTYIEEVRARKLDEISKACSEGISAGVTINGQVFSYTLEDQRNLATALELALATRKNTPYHADGQCARLFTPEEIIELHGQLSANLSHHITYANQLKLTVQNMATSDDISAVWYGQPLQGQYLDTYTQLIEQAQETADAYIQHAKEQWVWVQK